MKTVILLRHGKSDWDASFSSDAQRPLAPRGVDAAATMGRFVTAADRAPDLVVTSPAVRAATTAQLAHEAGGWTCTIDVDARLYGASANEAILTLTELPPSVDTVLLVGHQPTWGQLVVLMIGGGWVRFPTAAVACVDFGATDWSAVGPGRGELQFLIPPRALST